ncbi:neuropeptides capa receptor-like [Ptychodera flava]|uniref:neuropeptides capa receptor-like n=1 Tax=Ptychodera flava TaxID=63121 RepID=UPI00396A4518
MDGSNGREMNFTLDGNSTFIGTSCISSRYEFIVFMIVLVTIGICGNFAFMYVVITVKSMHTAVNWFFTNLSCADTLYLITHLFTSCIKLSPDYAVVQRSPVFGTVTSLADGIMLCTSIFTVAAISIERYLAISNPLKAHQLTGTKRIVKITVAIWVISILFNIPEALKYATNYDSQTQVILLSITALFQIITFIISLIIVVATNLATVARYRQNLKIIASANDSDMSQKKISRHEGQVLWACIGVSAIFLICATPTIYRLTILVLMWHSVIRGSFISGAHFCIFLDMSLVLESINSIINPFVYNATSSRCRRAFRQALDCKRSCCGGTGAYGGKYHSNKYLSAKYMNGEATCSVTL